VYKRILILIAIAFITLCVTGKDLTRYRVWLTDKAENAYNIEQPEEFLSTKAIERRAKRNIETTEQDLPVSNVYLQQIKEQGFNIFVTSRWMNTVVVAPTDSATLALYDTCGCKIWHTTLPQDVNKVDVSHIEQGIYIATLTTNNTQQAQKIIIR
jgi:hypothetical protein